MTTSDTDGQPTHATEEQGAGRERIISRLYLLTTITIIVGVILMCQPFTVSLYEWGFPIILAGVVMHIVLDHVP